MASATARAPKPGNRKARHVRQDERASTNFFSSNDNINITAATRIQFLTALGLSGTRRRLLAELIWEAGHG